MSGFIPRHGLTRNTKRLVFDALFKRQQGKCFICGISQAEIEAKWQTRAEALRTFAETLPVEHGALKQRLLTKYAKGPSPVHRKLYIDHCHWTGRIRGLLCQICNNRLGIFENCAFREKPEEISEWDFVDRCEIAGRWLEENKEVLFRYMQRDRWLPQKDILFHLQREVAS